MPNEMNHHFFWTITLANVIVRRTGIAVAAVYWVAQLIGSVIAAAFLVWFDVSTVISNPGDAGPLNPIGIVTSTSISWATQMIGPFFVVSVYLFKSYLGGTISDEESKERQRNTQAHVALAIGIFTALSFQFGVFSIDGTQWLPGHFASAFITGATPVIAPSGPFWFFSCWIPALAASLLYVGLIFIYGMTMLNKRSMKMRILQKLPISIPTSPPSAPASPSPQQQAVATASQYDSRRGGYDKRRR